MNSVPFSFGDSIITGAIIHERFNNVPRILDQYIVFFIYCYSDCIIIYNIIMNPEQSTFLVIWSPESDIFRIPVRRLQWISIKLYFSYSNY